MERRKYGARVWISPGLKEDSGVDLDAFLRHELDRCARKDGYVSDGPLTVDWRYIESEFEGELCQTWEARVIGEVIPIVSDSAL